MNIAFILNNKKIEVNVSPETTLLALLRDHLHMTGTKVGCEVGECGACSVIMDGKLVNSCLVLAPQVEGRTIITIEGVSSSKGEPNDLQKNFISAGAVQCGYCIPGMVMAGEALLMETLTPTRREIREAITGNLCRCTGYQQIIDAIETTAKERSGKK